MAEVAARDEAPARTIFLTGGTGFLGSHFLYARAHEPLTVYALVRGRNAAEQRERLLDRLDTCAASRGRPPLRERLGSRLRVVPGDITEPGCAVPAPALEAVAGAGVDEFWHFAASLNFEERRRERIMAQNIAGTRHALDLARAVGARRFLYVSTAYTVGDRRGLVEETLHPLDAPFNNLYEESKCRAEHAVAELCAEHALDYRILRPGIVVGPRETLRTGGSDSGLYGFVRTLERLKDALEHLDHEMIVLGEPETPIHLIPVDELVDDLCDLARRGFEGGPVYHLLPEGGPDAASVVDFTARQVGVPLRLGARRSGEPTPLEGLLDRRTRFYGSYLRAPKRFARSLPTRTPVSRHELGAYIQEFLKEFRERSFDTVFERKLVSSGDGTPLFAYAGGQPDRPALLLLNAYGMPVDLMVPLAKRLREHFFVVSWETRGVPSRSERFDPDRCGPDAQIEDAAAVLDHYGIGAAHVVGWCTGAQIALKLASERPERVRSLALLNGSYTLPPPTPITPFRQNFNRLMPRIAKSPAAAALYHRIIYGNREDRAGAGTAGADPRRDRQALGSLLVSTDELLVNMTSVPYRSPDLLYRYANLVTELGKHGTLDWLDGIERPVLVLSCRGDVIGHPDESREVARRLDAELVLLDPGDHFSLYNDEEQVASRLARFFRG